jgi:hypothetical protein
VVWVADHAGGGVRGVADVAALDKHALAAADVDDAGEEWVVGLSGGDRESGKAKEGCCG